MASSETARLDLYNALGELVGPETAVTLMTYLPDRKISDVVAGIEALRSEMTLGFLAANGRLDRMFLAVVAGLFTIVAAIAGVIIAVI